MNLNECLGGLSDDFTPTEQPKTVIYLSLGVPSLIDRRFVRLKERTFSPVLPRT